MITPAGTHYELRGEGSTTLILLHYFGSAGATWDAIAPRLSPGLQCVTPDLPGFGKTAPGAGFSIDDYAARVQELVDHLGTERWIIVGHSMGGKIALALAARQPAGLQSMVLLTPSPPTPEPMTGDERQDLIGIYGDAGKIGAHLQQIVRRPLADDVLKLETDMQLLAGKAAWHAWAEQGSCEDIADRMGRVNVPVLILGGDADDGISPEVLADEVAARLQGAQLRILPESGHLLHLERPDEIVSAILEWVHTR